MVFQEGVLASLYLWCCWWLPNSSLSSFRDHWGIYLIQPQILHLLGVFKFPVTETPAQNDLNCWGDLLGHILKKASGSWNWDLGLVLETCNMALPWWLRVKEPACNSGDLDLIPGSERSPGEGNYNLLQYSCPGNPMDREAWQATVHGVTKSKTRLNNNNGKESVKVNVSLSVMSNTLWLHGL